MTRLKTLSILAGLIAALAVSATPASAWWSSNTGQPDGKLTVNKSGAFTYEKGAEVKCPEAEIKGIWQIQTKGQIKNHGQEKEKQEPTVKGPHLLIQIKSWGKECEANLAGTKVKGPEVKVGECDFQLQQQKESLKATGGVASMVCVIKAAGICTIQVPIGMEKQAGSHEGINVGLKEIELENSKTNQIDKVNATTGGINQEGKPTAGIYATSSGVLCPLARRSETGSLTGLELTVEGANAV